MKLKIVTEKEEWDSFALKEKASFLQSFNWGRFKEKEGSGVLRLAAISNGEVVSQAQLVKEMLPYSRFYYHIPYGPVGGGEELFIEEAKRRGAKFLFVEPWTSFDKGKNSSLRIEPQKTSIIDLKKEDLLASFRKDTRYSIRSAKEVDVKEEEYTEEFFDLLKKTKERQGFFSYSKTYFPLLLECLDTSFFSARHKGKLVAAAIVAFFGERATYLHAASDHDYRKLKAPSLLQFYICEELKERGFSEYDLWGIDEKKLPGVSHFKKGFRGSEVVYPPSKRVAFYTLWYNAYVLGKKI